MRTTLNITFVALIFAGLFTSCKTTEEMTTSAPTPKDEIVSAAPAEAIAEAEVIQEDPVEREFFASIEKTPCFGTCPTYNMTIYMDGFVELEGIRHIDLIGKFTSQITDAQLQNFRVRAQRTGFMDMKDRYDGAVSDLPSATTTINLNGVQKSVFRRYEFPRGILQVEELFDDLLTSQKWTKVE